MKLLFSILVFIILSGCSGVYRQQTLKPKSEQITTGEQLQTKSNTMPLILTGLDNMAKGFSYWQLTHSQGAVAGNLSSSTFGCVEFDYTISTKGTVEDITITYAYPKGRYESAAIEAARKWKWQPSPINSDRMPVRMTNFFTFNATYKGFDRYCNKYKFDLSLDINGN